MTLVHVYNEWDPLEEVIVGTARCARIPETDHSTKVLLGGSDDNDIPPGPFPPDVLERTADELDELAETLRKLGVIVRRPDERDTSAPVATPDWSTTGFYDYCPRDGVLAIGNTIIETPMPMRARMFEGLAYKTIFSRYFQSGASWIAAPRPRLLDDMYDPSRPVGERLLEHDPAFDAANVLRFGEDLLYLVSDSGNELGATWLQRTLGDSHVVHPCRDLYASTHVDSTVVPLRPGLMLVNPARVSEANIPDFLAKWSVVECPDLVDTGTIGVPMASRWIGMNILMVRPDLAVVDQRQPELMRTLERQGVYAQPLQLTHSRTLGGSFHCVTLDVRRTGTTPESYR